MRNYAQLLSRFLSVEQYDSVCFGVSDCNQDLSPSIILIILCASPSGFFGKSLRYCPSCRINAGWELNIPYQIG